MKFIARITWEATSEIRIDTEVPFDKVSAHVAVIVEGGNVESVITNRPCQVVGARSR
jgi:hypothetical protein